MFNAPIFFERNRVWRVYSGGLLFSEFFEDEPKDGFFPEEWIASATKAINKEQKSEKEGVSRLLGSDVYFDELIAKHPIEMLGGAQKMRILVKILDSAVRLPAQAHPDKAFSRKHFNSEYGKTESWMILGTRADAKIYFGFRDGVDRDVLSRAIDESLTDKNAMERLMEYSLPKVGDVYLVPAKTVHAIGAGCLILEVQEPTDFTVQPEHWCDEYKLNDREMYLGLDKETAMDCFKFEKAPNTRLSPVTDFEREGVKKELIVKASDTECFIINRFTVSSGVCTLDAGDSYGVYIITDGEGEITGADYSKKIKKGDYFFMPACLMGKFSVCGELSLVECY